VDTTLSLFSFRVYVSLAARYYPGNADKLFSLVHTFARKMVIEIIPLAIEGVGPVRDASLLRETSW
jgi:hypothetical protein